MNSIFKAVIIALIVTTHLSLAFAQPKDQMGVIEFEEAGKTKDPFKETQEKAISYFAKLKGHLDLLASGEARQVPPPSDAILNHLTAVYLYCVSKKGVCAEILDSILEVDVINSKIKGSSSCSTMLRFWKKWMANDMERRQKFVIKTSFMQEFGNFNTVERPNYIQCTQTIKDELLGNPDAGKFFVNRYAKGSKQKKAVQETHSILEQVKANIPNVFVELGARGKRASSKSSADSASAGR